MTDVFVGCRCSLATEGSVPKQQATCARCKLRRVIENDSAPQRYHQTTGRRKHALSPRVGPKAYIPRVEREQKKRRTPVAKASRKKPSSDQLVLRWKLVPYSEVQLEAKRPTWVTNASTSNGL